MSGGNRDAACFLEFWMSTALRLERQQSVKYRDEEDVAVGTHSMMTRAAIASTMGTARATTQGSCRPRAASVPASPSYFAVGCAWEIVAGDLKATLERAKTMPARQRDVQKPCPIMWLCDALEVDILAIRDAPLNARRPVRDCTERAVRLADEHVVVLAPRHFRALESGPNLEPFCRGNREHGVRELCLELVETRLAEARRDVPDDARHRPANAVFALFRTDDALEFGEAPEVASDCVL